MSSVAAAPEKGPVNPEGMAGHDESVTVLEREIPPKEVRVERKPKEVVTERVRDVETASEKPPRNRWQIGTLIATAIVIGLFIWAMILLSAKADAQTNATSLQGQLGAKNAEYDELLKAKNELAGKNETLVSLYNQLMTDHNKYKKDSEEKIVQYAQFVKETKEKQKLSGEYIGKIKEAQPGFTTRLNAVEEGYRLASGEVTKMTGSLALNCLIRSFYW